MNLIKMRKRFDRLNKKERPAAALRSKSNGSSGALSKSVLNKCRNSLRCNVQHEIHSDNSTA